MCNVSIIGNIATAPERKYTPSGQAFVRFSVAENQGHRDRESGAWVEDEATFWPVTVWGQLAEHVAASLRKGTRVVVMGRTRTNSWENEAGEARSRIEVTADSVAPDLRFARATVSKVLRSEPADAPAAPAPATV